MGRRDGTQRTRELRALLMEWDPIDVADVPEAADEYDCMIGPLYQQLGRGADAVSLREWITRERVEHFGLDPDTGADHALADALLAWCRERAPRP